MAVYINQIKRRRELEQAQLSEALDRSAQRLGFRRKKRVVPQDDQSALRQILDALEVKDYELDEDDMITPEELLTGILRPRGIMMRRIRLTGTWWRECVGPLLGYTKDGHLAALTPTSTGLGYKYKDQKGFIRTLGRQEMEDHLKPTAIIFTKALPLRALKTKDLVNFAWSLVSGPNALLLTAAALVVVLLGMFTPMANKLIFDTVIPTGDAVDLLPITGLLVGATVGTMLFTLTRNLYITRVQHIVDLHTHNAIMARTFLLSPTFFSKHASGELTAKISNLSALCNMINETIIGAGLSAVLSLIYFMQLWVYGRSLLLPAFIILACQTIVLWLNYKRTVRIQCTYTQKAAQLSGLEYNMLAGIQKIKLTGSENRAFTRWLDYYTDQARPLYNPAFIGRLYKALTALLGIGGTAIIFWSTLSNNVSPSDYIAFSSAFGMMTAAMAQMNQIMPSVARIKPLLESVKPILEAVPEMEQKAPQVEDLLGSIEVSGLSFRYQEDSPLVLDDLSLKIESGEYVGIVGKSGSGKTTLMRLLLGFEQPLNGGIYYDNYDLSKVDKTSLRRKIGCCLQSGSLFTGDLFQNITITAPWATHKDVWDALRMACLDEDVRRMPMGLHTIVSEGGGEFSGGQKQRILIARALISKPQIIFFDEATSALDNISQKQVSENLDTLHCTRVVIAQRLSTIRHCDRIIVLNKGKIAEQGTYEELMEKKGLFYEMSLRQL
ncbi:MAG: ATP-binding cassette domain-containing protein [Prevotella sp.]|nr:ATP-binding cassette domain-containing protein [Prevotella sp.]